MYGRYSRLIVHRRTHVIALFKYILIIIFKYYYLLKSGYKPYKCDFAGCDKMFNEKGNLQTHRRVHTLEKPFYCSFDECKARFKAHGHLKDHMKKHYEIKPYICAFCKQSFARNSTLKMHLNVHSKIKPYLCNINECKNRFVDKAQLKYHMKSHFPDITPCEFENEFENHINKYKQDITDSVIKRNSFIGMQTKGFDHKPSMPKFIKKGNTYVVEYNNVLYSGKNINKNSISSNTISNEDLLDQKNNSKFLIKDSVCKNDYENLDIALNSDFEVNLNSLENNSEEDIKINSTKNNNKILEKEKKISNNSSKEYNSLNANKSKLSSKLK